MKKFSFLFCFCLLLTYTLLHAQNPVSVNSLTGAVGVHIPVLQISKGSVTVPIDLSYVSNGIRPKDVEGSAGIGWRLLAGGQIDRQLRGLPDDCSRDAAGNTLLGWLNNNSGTLIANFNISNDGNSASCADEISDINYINNNFPANTDTEPDIFNVQAPGLSCQLVLDQAHNFQILSAYQDLKIAYTTTTLTGGGSAIASFTITNDKGTKYLFNAGELILQKAIATPGTPVSYFAKTYNQYRNGVNFYGSWYLSSITDVNGNAVSFSYTEGPVRVSGNPVELFIAGSTVKSTQYVLQQTATQKTLNAITNGKDILNLNWQYINHTAGGSDVPVISSVTGMGRTLQFSYTAVGFPTAGGKYYRNFLRGFNDTGCSSPVNYSFNYYGETYSSSNGYLTTLSDTSSRFNDYWGYQNVNNSSSLIPLVYVNPSNPAYPRYTNYNYPDPLGADYAYSLGTAAGSNARSVDAGAITAGSLMRVTNVNGGTTTLVYEPNDYVDVPSSAVFKGSGIRIKTITDNDGSGTTANDIIRNYSYLDPTTGKSSGKPLSLPVFAFNIPYTGSATGKSYWESATVLSANDLSIDDHSILYKYCRESKTGAGSTLYQYSVPATYWDVNATPACSGCSISEWAPTQTNIARPDCGSYGAVRNGFNTYPFAPASNYEMERGLVQKVTQFNDAGTMVSESNYTYQRTGAPLIIQALNFEDNNGVKAYAKYNLYAGSNELTSQVSKKVFDSSTLSQAQSSTTNYTYSDNHHQLLKQQTTNSDNSTLTLNTSYTRDYAIAAPGTDSTVNAIYHLQNLHVNIPLESYTQVTRAGVTKTVSAQLTKFKTVPLPGNKYQYLPYQSLQLTSPGGTNFVPLSVAGGVATNDSQYLPSANYTAYDQWGILQTLDDNYRHVQTAITDGDANRRIASFKNATIAQVGFEDFDSNLPANASYILPAAATVVNSQSHTGKSLLLASGQSIRKAMSKKTGESYYVLSAWISSSAGGNLSVTLISSNNITATYTEPFTNTGGVSKYFEWKVPVSTTTAAFDISMSTNQQIYIDDLLLYPQTAEASTVAYDPVNHFKIAETNTNGISAYYKNDSWGRLLFAYDQDKNIREKNTYTNNGAQLAQLPVPFFTKNTDQVAASLPVSFSINNYSCITGVTYNWNFGDGTTVTGSAGGVQHTYTNAGNFTVTVTASHPQYGTQSASLSFDVKYPDLVPNMCQSGVTVWDNCHSPYKAVEQTDCGSNPNDNLHTYYTIAGTMGGSGFGTLHYQWQVSYDNTQTWSNVGTDSPQLIITYRNGTIQRAHVARCIVTSSVGQTGITNNNILLTQTCPQ